MKQACHAYSPRSDLYPCSNSHGFNNRRKAEKTRKLVWTVFLLLSKTNCLTGENNKIKKIEMV
jgi:hypothetical protein